MVTTEGRTWGESGSSERRRTLLAIGAVVLLALLLRLPGVPWGLVHRDGLQWDEAQHVGIAKNVVLQLTGSVPDASVEPTRQWNAAAFGTQLGCLGAFAHALGVRVSDGTLTAMGRLLSVAYGVGLVLVVIRLTSVVSGSRVAAILAGGFMAASDLHVTQSHYAIPEVSDAFWFASSALLIVRLSHGPWRVRTIAIASLAVGLAAATKFNPVPAAALVVVCALRRDRSLRERAAAVAGAGATAVACFWISWGLPSPPAVLESLRTLWDGNYDIVATESPYLVNPPLYAIAAICGVGLPMCALAVLGALPRSRRTAPERGCGLRLVVGMTAALFVLYLSGDSTFVRRAVPFLPTLALLAGVASAALWRSARSRRVVVGALVYTVLFSAVSQWAFVRDTRYEARRYLESVASVSPNAPSIAFSLYAHAAVRGLGEELPLVELAPDGTVALAERAEFVVLHEAYYRRYLRYFTTPLVIPASPEQVYHGDDAIFDVMGALLADPKPFRVVHRSEVWNPFPERVLFRAVFGTYETMLGDTIVYRR